jgi:hypothetical protein
MYKTISGPVISRIFIAKLLVKLVALRVLFFATHWGRLFLQKPFPARLAKPQGRPALVLRHRYRWGFRDEKYIALNELFYFEMSLPYRLRLTFLIRGLISDTEIKLSGLNPQEPSY